MSEKSLGEDLKLRLSKGNQVPDIVVTVDRGEDGFAVEQTFSGRRTLKHLLKEVGAFLDSTLPEEQLPDAVRRRLIDQFRSEFYGFFPPILALKAMLRDLRELHNQIKADPQSHIAPDVRLDLEQTQRELEAYRHLVKDPEARGLIEEIIVIIDDLRG